MTFPQWIRACLDRVEIALQNGLPEVDCAPAKLHEAMRYAVLGGGKRVLPLLCHATGELVGAGSQALVVASVSLELIHTCSLVHDDMPAMDNDALRRGKPTVHVQYGEAIALLVGDALQSQAFIALTADDNGLNAVQQAALMRELARASGSLGMAGGQAIDLESIGTQLSRAELETMHGKKTGALIRAAVRMGALCGVTPEASAMSALDAYAEAIGLAFQVVDDILDMTADSATLGKTAGKDAQHDKPTYVSMIGLDASRDLAHQLGRDARTALDRFGPQAACLRELANLVVNRVH
ncbi:farnesyl diphosphate synthase [Paraburkholderia sp.]|uniref:polyprenyl synthetase family protein n=1 Tax=Paraburkholderia sp. TaxID=1926495 RepID=UPI002F3FB560